jgi:hypothetical protein
VQVQSAKERWRAFCTHATQLKIPLLEGHTPGIPDVRGHASLRTLDEIAAAKEDGKLVGRVPALTLRMPDVLEPCIVSLCLHGTLADFKRWAHAAR